MSAPWTDTQTEFAKKRWQDGLSAQAIADELGDGFTRNAVLGKIHRAKAAARPEPIRLANHANAPRKAAIRGELRAPTRPRPERINGKVDHTNAPYFATAPLPEEPPMESSARMLTLSELKSRDCRWPLGDPRDEGFGFCGLHTDREGVSYCAGHMRMAYQPAADRRRDRGLARLA